MNSWRLATARERTADEYGILARQLIGDSMHASLEGAIVASVVPPLNSAMALMIRKYFGIEPLFVEPGVKTGIAIHVDNPQEVGADRIVNCVAAHDALRRADGHRRLRHRHDVRRRHRGRASTSAASSRPA